MAKLETNLSKKDKMTIAIVLGAGLIFMFAWFVIKPAITSIKALNEDIAQARSTETLYRNKIMSLTTAESVFDVTTSELYDSTIEFYDIMPSSSIDRMATTYVLSFGLYPEDLYITMPNGPVSEAPYIYSEIVNSVPTPSPTPTPTPATGLETAVNEAADAVANAIPQPEVVESLLVPYNQARASSNSTGASEVQCAELTLVMTGSDISCQALIDDLCTKPSIRITGFEWIPIEPSEVVDEETGEVELVESDLFRLRVDLRFYMADVTDYQALVSDAMEAAGAEG